MFKEWEYIYNIKKKIHFLEDIDKRNEFLILIRNKRYLKI